MPNTAERTSRVKLLAKKIQYKRETRLRGVFSALSLALFLSLVGVIRSMTGSSPGSIHGAYGAMLLYEDVGGYVLVGVVAFTVATVITLLCIRYREKN